HGAGRVGAADGAVGVEGCRGDGVGQYLVAGVGERDGDRIGDDGGGPDGQVSGPAQDRGGVGDVAAGGGGVVVVGGIVEDCREWIVEGRVRVGRLAGIGDSDGVGDGLSGRDGGGV